MEKIEIKNLSFFYPECSVPALSDITLSVKKGEYIALTGKSGSGKTTLLRMMKPCLAPCGKKQGGILIDNRDINNFSEREQTEKIGYVMQDPDSQIVTDKVWHELAFGAENLGWDSSTIRLRCAETAEFFGITEWFSCDVSELSGGQKQLLNLASVMVTNPEILLLDEPVSRLDPISAENFLRAVEKVNSELGVTVIIAEHKLENIFKYADKIAVIDSGKLLSYCSADETAKKISSELNFIKCSMPAAVRIFSDVFPDGKCPSTIRSAKNALEEKFTDIRFRTVEKKEIFRTEPAVVLRDINFQYKKNGRRIIDGLNAEFEKGKITAILGGNGAGKSTLLKIISGIIKPLSGKVKSFGGKISYLPQNPTFCFSEKTVREDLFVVSNNIDDIVAVTEIEDILDKHPLDISGGEIQKAATAKILLTCPDILLLDEPTKGLDGEFKEHFASILRTVADSGKTVIIVSHDVEFCAEFADICMMLFSGKIVAENDSGKFFTENTFYTTAARRLSRGVFDNAVTVGEVIGLCRKNL